MTRIKKKITKEELARIVGANNFSLVKNNVYCAKCGITRIVDYEKHIIADPSGETILRGNCKKCGHNVARVLETGESK